MERLQQATPLSPLQLQALTALLHADQPDALHLAEFQVQAIQRILDDLALATSRGVILGAGTGTGKTLAFYLPALTHLASLIEQSSHWTKLIAIYPRNELLKDQFSEVYREARRLDELVLRTSGRKITLGAFFGPTPRHGVELLRHSHWTKTPDGGFICPFLRCPRCDGDLAWRAADAGQGREELHCVAAACGAKVAGDEVLLTRRRLAQTPPDVLFTTTEMLNRQLSNSHFGHVFGVGPRTPKPRLVLLDEVHTYSGTAGAQAALLLRRFRHALGTKLQFTGLSATLRGAREFFSELTGLAPEAVVEITPREAELDVHPESSEYLIALRGDPASATSLLSTSIQAALLLRRVLDPPSLSPSRGLFGRRVFVFTDDLDVTNRLYHNLQDAEGLDSWNRAKPLGLALAALRASSLPDHELRLRAGQSWLMCEELGHALDPGHALGLGRTSSQDVGVDTFSDIVVATSALEVSYNDPEVGAVLQHKAPRDGAAFVQRKGRAGRGRTMRPWTVIVLSDYGRDRLAYQAYDQLFDPKLPRRSLPVRNRYVLRIQAAYALMDWVARELPAHAPKGSVWLEFSGPAS
jgi:ATP-dependent helicase YprA (DUF1998 family)